MGSGGVIMTGQVFISHTSDMELFPAGRPFAHAAVDAVNRAGMTPVDMRYFAAREGRPADYCRQRVAECDVYIAVIGFRYGSLVPGETVSYTELEFDAATGAGLHRLAFLLDEGAQGLPPEATDADLGPVEGFRQRLRDAGLVVRSFDSADRLELEVFHALRELAASPPRPRRPRPATARKKAAAALAGVLVLATAVALAGHSLFASAAPHPRAGSATRPAAAGPVTAPAPAPSAPASTGRPTSLTVRCSLSRRKLAPGMTLRLTYHVFSSSAVLAGLGAGIYDSRGDDHSSGRYDRNAFALMAGSHTYTRLVQVPAHLPRGRYELDAEIWPPHHVGQNGFNTWADNRCVFITVP